MVNLKIDVVVNLVEIKQQNPFRKSKAMMVKGYKYSKLRLRVHVYNLNDMHKMKEHRTQ